MLYAYGWHGCRSDGREGLAFVNEAYYTERPVKVVRLCVGRGMGRRSGEMNLNKLLVVDGERDITFTGDAGGCQDHG